MERNMPERSEAMLCPLDGTTLVMSERQNVEIDYCPACRGVWLDRGELDKIIERNAEASASPPPQQAHQPPPQQQQQAPWGQPAYGQYGHKPHKRRKGFLEELFD